MFTTRRLTVAVRRPPNLRTLAPDLFTSPSFQDENLKYHVHKHLPARPEQLLRGKSELLTIEGGNRTDRIVCRLLRQIQLHLNALNNLTDSALFKKFNFCLVFLPENVPTGSFVLIIEQKWLQ